ncbi:single-stranded DNA-binding protein [Nocardia puris]|uniref:single-stranded DNA-binding protein n=1 Tax=Nocardia TaxID=1817 RepID=UPI0004A6CE87|nr:MULTISPECIES: single-stranded DNA-binding protein [Nocardia]MBF6137241.1 single-stranded DNA-binding protein [Nocardia otitidiscaviarum]MBF6181845.1 single-stranded DNA-binding protein [Nocardia otitidiscaviarum]MBF6216266.1 single-stranded DNA-binding protein [Nocardia puris]MBF6461738.1 single-stranded DNA-binding protein [Nocardia puris]MBF6488138.1 single-stranded DNA-binding protein [Nocardia otitidiscaviarum]
MAGEIVVPVMGNLTADPEHKLLPSGQTVANFTVAQNSRVFDRESNEWRDGATVFMRCVAWAELADHVAATLAKGMRAVVFGRLRQRSYEDRNGIMQWITELIVDDIGPSLKYVTAEVHVREAADDEQPGARRGDRALVGAGVGDQPGF